MRLAAPITGLGLILFLLETRETRGSAHSLCLNFTVRTQVSPGQPWCEAQGSVDGKPFLQYDSDSGKATPVDFLGEKVKDTRTWTDATQTLEDVGQELRMVLLAVKVEDSMSSMGALNLLAKMCCQTEAEQCTSASWEFSINGKKTHIDTLKMHWTVVDPGVSDIKEELENNQDLAKYLRIVSAVDCNHWLKEFLKHWETALEPTESVTPEGLPTPLHPTSLLTAAPSSRSTDVIQNSSFSVVFICISSIISICLALVFLYGGVERME